MEQDDVAGVVQRTVVGILVRDRRVAISHPFVLSPKPIRATSSCLRQNPNNAFSLFGILTVHLIHTYVAGVYVRCCRNLYDRVVNGSR